MSTVNTANIHLVSKRNLANILKNGFSKEQRETNIDDKDKVYLNINDAQENTEKPISPDKVSVVVLRNRETKKLSTNPKKIEETMQQLQEGAENTQYEMESMPLDKYMDKMRVQQFQEFQKKIQSRDNYHLSDVALLISEANKNHDTELLSQMIELIKFDSNYQFAFDGGKLDLNKLYKLGKMNRSKVEAGMNEAEKREDRGENVDSTEIDAEEILEYSENEVEQAVEEELQEQENRTTDEIDTNSAFSKVTQVISRITKGLAKGVAIGLFARVARMNIRDKIMQRAEQSKERLNSRNQLKRDSQNKEELSREENTFNPNRDSIRTADNTQKSNEQNMKEMDTRQARIIFEEEIAKNRAKEDLENGQKLSTEQVDLLEKDKNNGLQNTLEQYVIKDKDFYQRTAQVCKEAAIALEERKSTVHDVQKDTEVQIEDDERE